MLEYALVTLVGLLGGVAVGIQSPTAGAIGQKLGGTASNFVVHLSGLIFSAILLVLQGGEKIRDWRTLPWYMPGAGMFGLILYQTINITLPRLGSTTMIALIIIGQLLTGIVIDHFGWFGVTARPVDLIRLIGLVVLFVGGYLITK